MISVSEIDYFINEIQNSWVAVFIVLYLAAFTGSFLNMLIYRLPIMIEMESVELIKNYAKVPGKEVEDLYKKNKDINLFGPRSKCNSCKNELKWFYNIPIISFLFLRGKCAFCKKSIGFRYIAVEIITVISFMVLYNVYGFTSSLFFLCVIFSALLATSIIDMKHKILPLSLTVITLFSSYFFAIFSEKSFVNLESSVLGSIFCFILIFSFINLYEFLRKKEQMMGRGDFGLFAIGGALYGFSIESIYYIFVASCLFGILSFLIVSIVAYMLKNKEINMTSFQMPFGPSISLAIFLPIFEPSIIGMFTFFV